MVTALRWSSIYNHNRLFKLKEIPMAMARSEEKMEKLKEAVANVCTMCGKPAVQLVDGEPSCADHIEQVYEHQVEDYTSKHLSDGDWRKA
jgi:hypothetical protein